MATKQNGTRSVVIIGNSMTTDQRHFVCCCHGNRLSLSGLIKGNKVKSQSGGGGGSKTAAILGEAAVLGGPGTSSMGVQET